MDKSHASSWPITGIVNKLGERIPYSEGTTRRRLLAGIIVALTIWSVTGHDVIGTNATKQVLHRQIVTPTTILTGGGRGALLVRLPVSDGLIRTTETVLSL